MIGQPPAHIRQWGPLPLLCPFCDQGWKRHTVMFNEELATVICPTMYAWYYSLPIEETA